MLSPSIEWHRPASVAEACNLLAGLEGAVPLAGGTDVVVDLRRGALGARHLVSLGDLGELRGIDLRGGDLRIGALATPAEMERSDAVRDHRPELLDAVSVFGGPQVRNRATVGGNLCTATSCGDMAPLLLALGARVVLAGPADGRREVPLAEFFTGPRTTVRTAAEILVEVLVPARTAGEGARYETFGLREAHYITVAGAAAALRLEGGTCVRARLVLGAVGPTPLPVPEADRALEGTGLGDGEIAAAAALAMEAALPVGDVRGSADHRRSLVEVLAARALRGARDRAKGGGL